MRVGIVSSALVAGGAQRVIVQLIKKWVEWNIEVCLILVEKKEHFFDVPKEVSVFEIGRRSNNSFFDKLKRYSEVIYILKKQKVDIILSLPEEIAIYVSLFNIGSGIPIIVSERNNPWVMPNVKITRFLRKISYCFVNGFIFQTKNAASFFSKKIQRKGVILANPLDLTRIPSRYDGERRKIIVSAGRLERQKNFLLLIESFSIFFKKNKDYTLCIYGEGKQREELQNYIKKKGLEGNVLLPGKNTNLLESIKDASVFVLSSDYEGVPNALIEAMATGIPVISTDCEPGGASDLIINEVNGLLVPVRDSNKLAEAISSLLSNPKKAEDMSLKALLVKERFNCDTVAESWLTFLKEHIKY